MKTKPRGTTALTATLLIIFIIFFYNSAFANVPANNSLDSIQSLFSTAASSWSPVLTGYAVNIFWILAGIDFCLMAINLALRPGEFSDITANLVRKILVIGFFWALVQPVGGVSRGISWAKSIVNSLLTAGNNANSLASGVATSPSNIFDTGIKLCLEISKATSIWSPIDSLPIIIGAFIIMIVFALIAAMMLLVIIQSYIVIYAGVLLLGFGGSSFTKDIALNYFKAALAVGTKLFVMVLIVGLGQTIITAWTTTVTIDIASVTLYIGASVVLLALVKCVPDMVGDLINGFSWGSGEPLSQTSMRLSKAAIGAAAGAAIGAVGGTMAVKEAASLAKASGAQGVGGVSKGIVSNLAKSAGRDALGRLSGQHWGHGTKGGRMASAMKEARLSTKSSSEDSKYYSEAVDVTQKGSLSKDKASSKG